MEPKEKAKEIYESIKYGVSVDVNGCFENNIPCKIKPTMPWASALKISHIICDIIIYETLTEYTNDENHDRVLYWQEVKKEVERL